MVPWLRVLTEQTWKLEFDFWKLCEGGRREPTLRCCSLTFTCVLPWHAHVLYTRIQENQINHVLDFVFQDRVFFCVYMAVLELTL